MAGSLGSSAVVSIDADIAFTIAGNKIHLPISEVVLRAAAGDLARSKKQRDWALLNSVLLLPLLTEAGLLDGETSMKDILNIFARTIIEREAEEDEDDEDEDKK